MRLDNFLITETRSKKISESEAYAFANDYCSNALNGYIKGTSRIFRGNSYLGKYYYMWEAGSERTSPYADNNIYNLLLSNLPSWKKYPKRNLSLVGTTDADSASHYGLDIFVVLPIDNAKIGVCPDYDIWDSFVGSYAGGLNSFNGQLARAIEKLTGAVIRVGEPKTYNVLLNHLNEIDNWKKRKPSRGIMKKEASEFLPYILAEKYINNPKIKLIDIIETILDPEDNGFKLMKSGSRFTSGTAKEVWTQDKCVLINMRELYKVYQLKT